jgi:hypothetical protein
VCRFQGSCCAIQPEITIPPSNPAVRAKPLPKVDPAVAPTALPIRKAAYQNTKVGMARSRSRTINNAGSPSSIHQLDYFRGRRITAHLAPLEKRFENRRWSKSFLTNVKGKAPLLASKKRSARINDRLVTTVTGCRKPRVYDPQLMTVLEAIARLPFPRALDPGCSVPSSPASVEVRTDTTESRFGSRFKRLLQQIGPQRTSLTRIFRPELALAIAHGQITHLACDSHTTVPLSSITGIRPCGFIVLNS